MIPKCILTGVCQLFCGSGRLLLAKKNIVIAEEETVLLASAYLREGVSVSFSRF
jgi:hypothetical protein